MRCAICSSGTIPALRQNDHAPMYHQCPQCDYIAMDAVNVLRPDEEKSRYLTHENTPDNAGYVQRFRDFIEKCVSPYQDGMKTALDFGCGPGPVLADLLRQQGFTVDVYDPYFAPSPGYTGNTYDLITATETFEHIQDPLGTLRTLKEHLNRTGILSLMTLFHPNERDVFRTWWYRKDPTHISFYTPKTFRILSECVGLRFVMTDGRNLCVLRNE